MLARICSGSGLLTVYQFPHCLVSGNEFVGAGTALDEPVEAVRFVDAQGSVVPPGGLPCLTSVDTTAGEILEDIASRNLRNADLEPGPDDSIAADRIEVWVPCEEMS